MATQSGLLPPVIVKYRPAQSGIDNAGIGETAYGERYLLKTSPDVALAEFVGASVCLAVGIPCGTPAIVEIRGKYVFGSRLEAGVSTPASALEITSMIRACANPLVFSAVLAVDLATGNPDRHWHNWLYQQGHPEDGRVTLRAIDFSRAWPTSRPPLDFPAFEGENTYTCWKQWPRFGITFDQSSALNSCERLARLDAEWLARMFEQLPVEWMVSVDGPGLCQWWAESWASRVASTQTFLQSGAWA